MLRPPTALLAATLAAGLTIAPAANAQEPKPYELPLPEPGPTKPEPTKPKRTKNFGFERLSNERTRTSWAYVGDPVFVRARPRYGSRRKGRLRTRTFSGSPETVVVLGELRRRGKGSWSRVRYPGLFRRLGWVPTRALGRTFVVHTRLIVDRRRRRVRLHRRGRVVFGTRVGIGKPESPTPGGRYYVRERLVPQTSGGIYGVLAFGLSSFSPYRTDWPGGGQVGLHGTNQPHLIPGRISNGCVRLRNHAVLRLDRLLPVGTPVVIR